MKVSCNQISYLAPYGTKSTILSLSPCDKVRKILANYAKIPILMDIIALVGVIERHHEIRFKFFKIFSKKVPNFSSHSWHHKNIRRNTRT